MPDPISLIVVADTAGILAAHAQPSSTPDRPTPLSDAFCYLIGPASAVEHGQATSHLRLRAGMGQEIRWRVVSLSGHGVWVDGVARMQDDDEPLPRADTPIQRSLPILSEGRNTDPPTFTIVTATDHALSDPAPQPGTTAYRVVFGLGIGEATGFGWFEWRPCLEIVGT